MNEEMNVNVGMENDPVEVLHDNIAALPQMDPNATVMMLPPEEESNDSLKYVLGGAAVLAAGIAGGVAWFKHRAKTKNKRIAELEAELAYVRANLGESVDVEYEETDSADEQTSEEKTKN